MWGNIKLSRTELNWIEYKRLHTDCGISTVSHLIFDLLPHLGFLELLQCRLPPHLLPLLPSGARLCQTTGVPSVVWGERHIDMATVWTRQLAWFAGCFSQQTLSLCHIFSQIFWRVQARHCFFRSEHFLTTFCYGQPIISVMDTRLSSSVCHTHTHSANEVAVETNQKITDGTVTLSR